MIVSKKSILLFILLLCLAGLIWAFSVTEWVEKSTDLGPRADIKRQEFLAAQRFMEAEGVKVHVEMGLTRLDGALFSDEPGSIQGINKDKFPSTDDVIILGDSYGSLSENRANRLLEWVKGGGNLMLTASNRFLSSPQDRTDHIFEYFGISVLQGYSYLDGEDGGEPSTKAEIDDNTKADNTNADKSDANDKFNKSNKDLNTSEQRWDPRKSCTYLTDNIELQVFDEDTVTWAIVPYGNSLDFDEERKEEFSFWASNRAGVQIIQRHYGEGFITFFAGINSWKNYYIACADNAYLLRFFAGAPENLWFLVNQDSLSIFDHMLNNFIYGLIALVILTLLAVWHYGQRFGVTLPKTSFNRRKIMEHIDASALFLWRSRDERWQLVEAVQNSIRKKMQRRYASFETKTRPQQIELIAKFALLPAAEIELSMVELTDELKSKTLTEHSFTDLMQSLKRIEEKL